MKASTRLESIDCFRGICMFNMILGDYAYGVTPWWHHSPWQGMTVDDPTFPSFVFVMGIGIGLSMDRLRDRTKSSYRDTILFIWRRAFTLIFLNVIFQGWYQSWYMSHVRIPGVLFRLGWLYGIVGTICVSLPTLSSDTWNTWIRVQARSSSSSSSSTSGGGGGRGDVEKGSDKNGRGASSSSSFDTTADSLVSFAHHMRDILELAPQWFAIFAIYLVWFMITYFLPVPCGGGRGIDPDHGEPVIGYTGPGGVGDDEYYYWCSGGAQAYVDRLIFGENHVQEPRLVHCMEEPSIMCPRPVDDLGALGTLAACVSTMLGVQAAMIYLRFKNASSSSTVAKNKKDDDGAGSAPGAKTLFSRGPRQILTRWLFWSLFFGILATVLCSGCNWFDWTDNPKARFAFSPVIKITWTPSFICAMASIDFLVLALLYALIDLPGQLRIASGVNNGGAAGVAKPPPAGTSATSINESDAGKQQVKKTASSSFTSFVRGLKGWNGWSGQPFRSFGRNAILFYMLCLMAASWIPILKPQFFLLSQFTKTQKVVTGIAGVGVWMVCAYYLDRRNWYWVVGREPFTFDDICCGVPSKCYSACKVALAKMSNAAKGDGSAKAKRKVSRSDSV